MTIPKTELLAHAKKLAAQRFSDPFVEITAKRLHKKRLIQEKPDNADGNHYFEIKGEFDPSTTTVQFTKSPEITVTCDATEEEDRDHFVLAVAYYILDTYKKEEQSKGQKSQAKKAQNKAYIRPFDLNQKIDEAFLKDFAGEKTYQIAESYFKGNFGVKPLDNSLAKLVFEFTRSGITNTITFSKKEENQYLPSCTCSYARKDMVCVHITFVLLFLHKNYGGRYFYTINQGDEIKQQQLAEYGYNLESPEVDELFEFERDEFGHIHLKVISPGLQRLTPFNHNWQNKMMELNISKEKKYPWELEEQPEEDQRMSLGFCLDLNKESFPFFQFYPIYGKKQSKSNLISAQVETVDPFFPDAKLNITEEEKQLLFYLQKTDERTLEKKLAKMPKNEAAETIEEEEKLKKDRLNFKISVLKDLLETFQVLFQKLKDHPHLYILPEGAAFTGRALEPLEIDANPIKPVLYFDLKDYFLHLSMGFEQKSGQYIPFKKANINHHFFLFHQNTCYLFSKPKDIELLFLLGEEGFIKVNEEDFNNFVQETIKPLLNYYEVHISEGLMPSLHEPLRKGIFLKELPEQEQLLIIPVFQYGTEKIIYPSKERPVVYKGEQYHMLQRSHIEEREFLSHLGEQFKRLVFAENEGFSIQFDEAIKDSWIVDFYATINDSQIDIFGYQNLQHLNFTDKKARVSADFNSNIDWFDLKIDIYFGDEKVTLDHIKKALNKGQHYILLSDGQKGLIPDSFIKQYSYLLKMGKIKGNQLSVSKVLFSLIDELYSEISNEDIKRELDEKKEKIKTFNNIEEQKTPQAVKAELRPYQKAGFNWMNFLEEFRWGGCLADDMGLGKTLQTLTFIRHLLEEDSSRNFLVICPNSLVFNWENEIHKFCPDISYSIHHGPDRTNNAEDFSPYQVVISTYGTVRSDIEMLRNYTFYYVILDESQMIKNPKSKISKATQLLNAQNRLILSGTPLQNNTMDLFAQMNFINPGMLGTREFFKKEFSDPIDRDGNEQKGQKLRQIIYPFILRRTKQQVASELPDKIENTLFCELKTEQREIYNEYKNRYKRKIFDVIAEKGIERSGIHILEGLLKLRQICDSPAILKDQKYLYPNSSVKIEELVRELKENVAEHKALVFSQFIGMLQLIKEDLIENGIKFEYLDGKTQNRKATVERFQNDDSCKVFLISLTVGGLGLNLTAADYVYLVDPWWNPAVEKQAIDRTHRIGQTKKIFAYKMICKDTIEEKILKLQNSKQKVADGIITHDASFIKMLSKDDISYLFD